MALQAGAAYYYLNANNEVNLKVEWDGGDSSIIYVHANGTVASGSDYDVAEDATSFSLYADGSLARYRNRGSDGSYVELKYAPPAPGAAVTFGENSAYSHGAMTYSQTLRPVPNSDEFAIETKTYADGKVTSYLLQTFNGPITSPPSFELKGQYNPNTGTSTISLSSENHTVPPISGQGDINRMLDLYPASLIGADGASLIGADGASLIGADGASLIGADGASLIGADGASFSQLRTPSLIGADGASLIGADGASLQNQLAGLIGADGASLIGADGASLMTKAYVASVANSATSTAEAALFALNALASFLGYDAFSPAAFKDPIVGTNDTDLLEGTGDWDKMIGLSGIDVISAGYGDDRVFGDFEYVYNEGQEDLLSGGGGQDFIQGGGGDDDIWGDFDGSNGARDDYALGADKDEIEGGDGNDEVYAGGGDDKVWGGDDNDKVYGGDNKDYLDGDRGDDHLLGGDHEDDLHGDVGNDTIDGGNQDDKIFGEDGNDTLIGGAVDSDVIHGGWGADNIDAGYGDDRIYGDFVGAANASNGDADYVAGGGGKDIVSGGGGRDFIYGDFANMSPDKYVLGADADILYGEGGADDIYGGGGNDQISGGDEEGAFVGDWLRGGDGDDLISGGHGEDHLIGGAGLDTMDGGRGNDNYYVESTKDKVIEQRLSWGFDIVYSTAATFTMGAYVETLFLQTGAYRGIGGSGVNYLYGNAAGNLIEGMGSNDYLFGVDKFFYTDLATDHDVLKGGAGKDHMYGGKGDDRYYVDAEDIYEGNITVFESKDEGRDTIYSETDITLNNNQHIEIVWLKELADKAVGNEHGNRLNGGARADRLEGKAGGDTLAGDRGIDTLLGHSGDDFLYGEEDGDTLSAGTGADKIYGGIGRDLLYGGGDAVRDTFFFSKGDSGITAATWDQVYNFRSGIDKIDLNAIDADPAAGVQNLRWVSTFSKPTSASQVNGQVRVLDAGSHVNVQIDHNGDNVADMVLQVMNVANLSKGDFLL